MLPGSKQRPERLHPMIGLPSVCLSSPDAETFLLLNSDLFLPFARLGRGSGVVPTGPKKEQVLWSSMLLSLGS